MPTIILIFGVIWIIHILDLEKFNMTKKNLGKKETMAKDALDRIKLSNDRNATAFFFLRGIYG